jgi:hypothetical protein
MSSPPMWAVLASIEFVSFAVFTGYLVRYYAAKGTPFYALAMVFVSWCVCGILGRKCVIRLKTESKGAS